MIDSYEKYRQVAKYAGGYFEEQFLELINRLEAAETAWKEADKACRDLTEKVIPNLRESLEAAERDVALKEKVIDALGSELNAVANERDSLHTALEKIADWDSAWGPYPETNEAWRAMVIVTAREAVPRRGEPEMTRDKLQKRIYDVIAECIRNDYAFGSYAHKVAEAVWPVLEAAEKERDAAELMSLALRAKIEQMEKQEPVGTLHDDGYFVWRKPAPREASYGGWKMTLYALPGAQGE